MADNYLEKRYDELFGSGRSKTIIKKVGTPVPSLLEKLRKTPDFSTTFPIANTTIDSLLSIKERMFFVSPQPDFKLSVLSANDPCIKLPDNLAEQTSATDAKNYLLLESDNPHQENFNFNCGILVQTLLLRATELGLKTRFIQNPNKQETVIGLILLGK